MTTTHSDDVLVSFRVSPAVRDALFAIKERDGIPLSEQYRRALRLWLDTKAEPKAKRGRRAAHQ